MSYYGKACAPKGSSSSPRSWRDIARGPKVSQGDVPDLDPKLKSKDILVGFKNFVNDPIIKKAVRIGGDIASAIAPFSEEPTMWNGFKAAFIIGKSFIEHFEIYAHDFFDDEEGWVEPFPRDFTGAVLKVLKKYPYETMKTSSEGSVIHLVKLPEGKVGWLTNTKYTTFRVDRIYAEADKVNAIRDKIKFLLWDQFKGKAVVLRRNTTTLRSLSDDRIVLEVDDAFHPLPSALADTYSKYLKRAIDGGVNRAVMLYGPPGTGKSTMARKLVEDLKLRSLRIRIEDVGGLESSTLFEAIDIFKPDAIILDDFDRAGGQEQLLETLEYFTRHIKLLIATVNKRDNLDEALLRPGRFDELLLVKQMDDNVIKNVLGEENLDAFDKVKSWPIAFIQEFVKRRRFMSKTEAMKSIKELAERVERLSEYDEDSDIAKILRRRKKPAKGSSSKGQSKKAMKDDLLDLAMTQAEEDDEASFLDDLEED